jgi:glycosyltransferase involved in cell wall biosynthesis
MKILVLSSKPPWPPHDGGAVATMRCIEGLAGSGATVSLLTMKTEKHNSPAATSDNPPAFLHNYVTVTVDTHVRPLKMLTNLLFSTEPYDLLRFISERYVRALSEMLSTEHFDIIQCEGLLFSYYLGEIRRITSAPVVLRAHNIEHRIREMMAGTSSCPIEKAYLGNLARRIKRREVVAAKSFDAIVPISGPDYEWFKSVTPDKPMLLTTTGIAVSSSDNKTDDHDLKVGFIGALNWQPNVEGLKWFIKEVWPQVLKNIPAAILHIAGKGADTKTRRRLRGDNIVFEGEVEDARHFMDTMTVIIAPLFAGSGLRIKIIEAMSAGKTMVATPMAAAGLPVHDRRELLIGHDTTSFCNALVSALHDPQLRASTGAAARELMTKRFDNERQTAKLLEFYNMLCDGR